MTNLLNTLSKKLQDQLKDYNVTCIFIQFGEVNTVSDFDLDFSFYEAIENELKELGHEII